MGWDFRVESTYRTHPKFILLKQMYGSEGVDAVFALWAFATEERPKGVLTNMTDKKIAAACGIDPTVIDPTDFVNNLVEIGFLDRAEDGVVEIHNWKKRQPNIWSRGENLYAQRRHVREEGFHQEADGLAGIGFFAAGQLGRGAEKILPTGLSKIPQAARESSQGVSTSKNFPVVGPDGKRLMPTAGESAAKALGFRPAREAMARARTSEAIEEEKRWSEKRDRIYSRFRAFTLAGGRDADERQSLVAAVADYNKGVADAGLSGRVSSITRESLLRQTERLARPTKREQARLGDKPGVTKPYAAVSGEDIEDFSHPYFALRRDYAAAKDRYDALRQAGDLEGAAALRGEARLPLLRRLIGRVSSVREEMGKVRSSRLADDVKSRRLDVLRERERLEMDRAARTASGLAAASGE